MLGSRTVPEVIGQTATNIRLSGETDEYERPVLLRTVVSFECEYN